MTPSVGHQNFVLVALLVALLCAWLQTEVELNNAQAGLDKVVTQAALLAENRTAALRSLTHMEQTLQYLENKRRRSTETAHKKITLLDEEAASNQRFLNAILSKLKARENDIRMTHESVVERLPKKTSEYKEEWTEKRSRQAVLEKHLRRHGALSFMYVTGHAKEAQRLELLKQVRNEIIARSEALLRDVDEQIERAQGDPNDKLEALNWYQQEITATIKLQLRKLEQQENVIKVQLQHYTTDIDAKIAASKPQVSHQQTIVRTLKSDEAAQSQEAQDLRTRIDELQQSRALEHAILGFAAFCYFFWRWIRWCTWDPCCLCCFAHKVVLNDYGTVCGPTDAKLREFGPRLAKAKIGMPPPGTDISASTSTDLRGL